MRGGGRNVLDAPGKEGEPQLLDRRRFPAYNEVKGERPMKVKYIGKDFDMPVGLRNGKTYRCLGVEYGLLRIIDESGEDYLYSAINPRPLDNSSPGGKWEIVEDDEDVTLRKAIYGKIYETGIT